LSANVLGIARLEAKAVGSSGPVGGPDDGRFGGLECPVRIASRTSSMIRIIAIWALRGPAVRLRQTGLPDVGMDRPRLSEAKNIRVGSFR